MIGVAKRLVSLGSVCAIAVGLTLITPVFVTNVSASTRNVPVELTIPSTTITVTGRAAPNSLVVIKDGANLVASVSADSSGYFSQTITASPGVHEISAYYTDVYQATSTISSKSISVQSQHNSNVDFLLSPTIQSMSNASVTQGAIVAVRGYAYPDSSVKLNVNYGQLSYFSSTNSSGYYEFFIHSNELPVGEATFQTLVDTGSGSSDLSGLVKFEVSLVSEKSKPDILVSPNTLSPPVVNLPESGAQIDGTTALISGVALPNSQINMYKDGVMIGSVFADASGNWTIEYAADNSGSVTLVFEVCRLGVCSLFSTPLVLNFLGAQSNLVCSISFELDRYRLWGLRAGEPVDMHVLLTSGDGQITVDWGDGVEEVFDHDSDRPSKITRSYAKTGEYNGFATFYQDSCSYRRYFSAHVINAQLSYGGHYKFLVVVFLSLATMYVAGRRFHTDNSKSPAQKGKSKV